MRIPVALASIVAVSCLAIFLPSFSRAESDGSLLSVRSSLAGKSSLPSRVYWLAYPSIPSAKVARVDYLIDGKVRWIERTAPYVYGGDDAGLNKGFLITTWLTPAKHRFTVRVFDTSGKQASAEVVSRVSAPPTPPPALAGTWTRTVTAADLKKGGSDGPPAGVWKLIFDPVGAWHLDPQGSGVVNQFTATPNRVNVYAPIWMAPEGISRFGHSHLGGNDCNQAGPFGYYRWAATGGTLKLNAIKEACGNRRAIWEGVWKRIS